MQLERLGVKDEDANIVQSPKKIIQEESSHIPGLITKKDKEIQEGN